MADLFKVNADREANLVHAGSFGNQAAKPAARTLAAAAIADVVYLAILPAGTRVVDFRAVNDALGVGVTVSYGYKKVDPNGTLADNTTYFLNAQASAAAGSARTAAKPIRFEEAVYLIATVGGGAATGEIVAIPEYVYEGK